MMCLPFFVVVFAAIATVVAAFFLSLLFAVWAAMYLGHLYAHYYLRAANALRFTFNNMYTRRVHFFA